MESTRSQRFESLFRAHYPAVRGYALRRTSPEAAQDAVAETFLVAWRRFEDVPEDALPWLYGVARRVLANQRRSAGRSAALTDRLGATAADAGSHPLRLRYRFGNGKHWAETQIRFLVYERLPLDAAGRAALRMDPHPGAQRRRPHVEVSGGGRG